MKIVIDLPDDLKDKICDSTEEWAACYIEGYDITIARIIRNGTPLPKGHGRLIDADEFHYTLEDMPIRDNDKWFNWLQKACNRLAEAPTIIEADKEAENGR